MSKRSNYKHIGAVGAILLCLSGSAFAEGIDASKRRPDQNDFYSTVAKGASEGELAKADDLRQKTIQSISQILKGRKSNDTRGFELLLRLGELHAERHDYLRDLEIKRWEQAVEKWQRMEKKGDQPHLSDAASKVELNKAVNAFRNLVNEHPKNKRTASALFSLGKTLARLGNDNSIMYFERLIRDHGTSELIPDALLAAGEYYFDKYEINKSIDAYRRAIKFKDHRSYPYMVYKLGWAYYNSPGKTDTDLDDARQKAMTAFKLVIKLSDRGQTYGRIALRNEALRDLVMVWAETKDVDGAFEYFRSLDETSRFYDMLMALGATYKEQGQNEKGVKVFTRVLAEAPQRGDAPEALLNKVAMQDVLGREKDVVRDLKEARKLFLMQGPWMEANAKSKIALDEAKETIEKAVYKYAATYHKRGAREKEKSLTLAAVTLYEEYLNGYQAAGKAIEVRYYLADLQMDLKRYQSAADNFHKVYREKPDGKNSRDAIYSAVVCLSKLQDDEQKGQLPKPGTIATPLELSQTTLNLLSYMDEFAKSFSADKEVENIRLQSANILFERGHYEDAVKRYAQVVEVTPASEEAKFAVKNIFAYYSLKENYSKVVEWARRFKENKAVVAAGHLPTVVAALRAALFNSALAHEKAKQHKEAAQAFLTYQAEFPQDQNADRALFNAGNNYYKLGNVEAALETSAALVAKYPKSDLLPDVLLTSAESYEALTQFDEAAEHFEKFSRLYPNRKGAPVATFNAGVMYKGLQKKDKTVSLMQEFVARYPKHELYTHALSELATALEDLKRYPEAVEAFQRFADASSDRDVALHAMAKAGQIQMTQVDRSRGLETLRAVRKELQQKGAPVAFDARRVVSNSLFDLIQGDFTRFMAMKVTDPASIEKQVGRKQAELVRIVGLYQGVIKIGAGEYSVASLYRIGEMHENFAQVLFSAPAPAGVTQVVLDQYRTEIEKVAFPLRDQAYEFYSGAFKRSQEVEAFSEWTKLTYEKMSELSPRTNPEIQELSTEPRYISHRLQWDEDLRAFTD
jgi:TolA-binding protein